MLAAPNEKDRLPKGDLMPKMDKACTSTRDLVARNPIEHDRRDGYLVAQAWPFVTALYSGVKQALKMPLMTADPQLTLDAPGKRPYGHDLSRLYADLSPAHAEHIELHFHVHRSLFENVQQHDGFESAKRFITHINGNDAARGHIRWRRTCGLGGLAGQAELQLDEPGPCVGYSQSEP